MFVMRASRLEAQVEMSSDTPAFYGGVLAMKCVPCARLLRGAPDKCPKCGAASTETIIFNLPDFMLDDIDLEAT
jgi:rubrerythrin